MLGKYRGIPTNAWIEEVVSNLEYRFGINDNTEDVISFEQNEQLKGLEHLSDIIDATINHQPLDIDYCTFKGKEIKQIIHPYYVKQYNDRWFLFGLDDGYNRISNIALDRIKYIDDAKIEFKTNKTTDFNTYFDKIIGVTIPNDNINVEQVKLKFTPERFPYVVSKPIHSSQDIVDDEICTISLSVIPNKELEQKIFSFGPDVEVLSPEWFRTRIKNKIEENLKKYQSL